MEPPASDVSAGRVSMAVSNRFPPTPISTRWASLRRCFQRRTLRVTVLSVSAPAMIPDPEDDGEDVVAFADFMRSTTAPPRGPISSDVLAGEALFNKIGCAVCHTPSITTAKPGAKINDSAFTVPAALGNKIIHPYSDFLLHD